MSHKRPAFAALGERPESHGGQCAYWYVIDGKDRKLCQAMGDTIEERQANASNIAAALNAGAMTCDV